MANKKRRNPRATSRAGDTMDVPSLSPEEQAARREQQRREWAERKRSEERRGSLAAKLWIAAGVAAIVAITFGVAFFAVDTGSGGGPVGTPVALIDPRVGAAAPTESLALEANDDGQNVNPRFSPTVLNAPAGEIFEVVVTNAGSVHHNLSIDGGDGDFGSPDDFTMLSVGAGEVGRLKAKLNDAGTYPFRCDLHPGQQTGTLIVS